MKKTLCTILTLAMTSFMLTACSNVNDTNDAKDASPKQSESSSTSKEIRKILWEHAGELEAQKGSDKNIGTAGVLYGKIDDYIIVGGGANFPNESPAKDGEKKHYPDIYLLEEKDGQLNQVDHITLNYEIGYGSSITSEEGVYYIGGSPDEKEADNVSLFTVNDKGKIDVKNIGDLPFTFSDGIATKYNDKIYIGLGKQNGEASNKFYEFDISSGNTKELSHIPGETTRNQSVSEILNDSIYVFSGGDKVAYTDGYKYDLKSSTWSKVSDVEVDDEKISLLGARSIKLNKDELLVIGGSNKEIYDNAVKNLGSLKDNELAQFKENYFGADPHDFNWNKKVLIYNSNDDNWRSIGEIPFNAPCGAGLVLSGDYLYSINGEVKPGTRTNNIYSGNLIYK